MCFDEIVKHKFMNQLDFTKLHEYRTPFVPRLKDECDTQYFDQAGKIETAVAEEGKWWDDQIFTGYSYRQFPQTQIGQKDRVSIRSLFEGGK